MNQSFVMNQKYATKTKIATTTASISLNEFSASVIELKQGHEFI